MSVNFVGRFSSVLKWLPSVVVATLAVEVAVGAALETADDVKVQDTSQVVVTDAIVRALPPGRTVTAAFFQIENPSDIDCHLTAATTPATPRAEVHTHLVEDGLMKMREVESVAIKAGETLHFKPGGLHIMLYEINKPLKHGDRMTMTLKFKECGDVVVDAQVRHPGR